MFLRDTIAFIGYFHNDTGLLYRKPRGQRHAMRRVGQRLKRIQHQIDDHLLYVLGIASDGRQVRREVCVEPRRASGNHMRQ